MLPRSSSGRTQTRAEFNEVTTDLAFTVFRIGFLVLLALCTAGNDRVAVEQGCCIDAMAFDEGSVGGT